MAEALTVEAFSELPDIARAAEALTSVAAELRGDGSVYAGSPAPTDRPERASVVAMPASLASTDKQPLANYPQFYRHGDRLVKRAWSKKERQPYEHKAPREIVEVLLGAIRKYGGDQQPFEAGDIMPLVDSNGNEYPSYQAYLVLGWLRSVGAIAKGRTGYLLKREWTTERVAHSWDSLTSVA